MSFTDKYNAEPATFDVDANPTRPTLFLILLAITAILCISLFFVKSALLFVALIVFAIITYVFSPKKKKDESI